MLNELGVERITIDLPFKLNHVHCFLAEGENGWKIIDAGLHNENAIEKWQTALSEKKLTDIYVTHYHPDHVGYAGQLQREKSANVWMTKTEAHHVEFLANHKDFREPFRNHYLHNGISEDLTNKLLIMNPMINPLPTVTGYMEEGQKVTFGELEYEVIYTPGHSDGLICLYNEEKKILFSTDHILPRITPNISIAAFGHKDPLRLFFDSLQKIKKLDILLAIPSHGEPFENVKDRIEDIENHHYERLEQIIKTISIPKTAYEVCETIFRKNLTVHELRFALGEALSHLEYLTNQGKCTKEMKDGIWFYCSN